MAGSDLAASDQEQEFVEANHFLKRPLLSEQAPGISRDQHAAPGSSPPANGAGGRGRITEILSEQRPLLLTNLLMLIPFVDEEHRAKNQAQFARNAAMLAPIEDESWEHVAFIAGIYGRYMWKQPLNEEQKRGMWQALLWAVRYEQYFRPKLVNDRCGEMLNFLNGSAQDAAFLQDASEDLTALLPDLNTLTVKKLAERLSRLTQVPQGVIEQFQAKIAEHLTLLPSPPTSRSGVPRSTLTPEAFSGERLVFEGKKQRGRYSLADRKIKRAAQQYGTAAVASGPARAWPAESYAALAFLGEEKSRKLLECIQASHLEHVSGILREARRGIFEALSQALADVLKHELLPPRRSLRIRGTYGVDLFPEARVAILSEEQESWRRALHLFEMGERQAGRKDFKMIAREWSLFAQARIYGPVKAAVCWEEEHSQGVASWEEVWNLAAFYLKIQKPDLALNVLEPGVVSARAPFAHLHFALYCAVHILIGGGYVFPPPNYSKEEETEIHRRLFPLSDKARSLLRRGCARSTLSDIAEEC